MTWAGNDGVLQPGDTWRCINVSLPSDDGYNRRWQLQPRKSEGHAILVVDVNRFQPLVLPINRGLHHIAHPFVASDIELLLLL